jgi:hypothetical protein
MTTRTDRTGSFTFPPTLPGEFRVIVAKRGYKTHTALLAVDDTSAVSAVRISLSR